LKHLLRSESEGDSAQKAALSHMNQLLSGFSLPQL
jgi:hypothetical protein